MCDMSFSNSFNRVVKRQFLSMVFFYLDPFNTKQWMESMKCESEVLNIKKYNLSLKSFYFYCLNNEYFRAVNKIFRL